VAKRNAASQTSAFDAVLRAHARMHDLSKPLVRADYDHAIDTWHWVLRLAPDACRAVQIAALFHDVERLLSETDERAPHLASDYDLFKEAHARRGAELARDAALGAGVDRQTAERVYFLVAHHEQPDASDPDLVLLNDADALSFFALNSPGYLDYFGPDQSLRKVKYTLARLSAARRPLLADLPLRRDVRILLETACASSSSASP
jgi:hypothetical protein